MGCQKYCEPQVPNDVGRHDSCFKHENSELNIYRRPWNKNAFHYFQGMALASCLVCDFTKKIFISVFICQDKCPEMTIIQLPKEESSIA